MDIEERLDRLINLIETSINFENPEKALDSERKYKFISKN